MAVCGACGAENPEGARFCNGCGAPLEAPASERRKLATLLFCDMSGSTAMGERVDAESVRSLMLSYFHEMRGALERHGGTVEKFVGDAVLAVFGVPTAHEDDALRACRAALEMQRRLAELNQQFEQRFGTRIALRIGLSSGEVVAGDASSRETFVTGDPVNVAARLEQAARPGEVLIGERTLALVRSAVRTEAIEPLSARGKAEPVPAYRLLAVDDFAPSRHGTRTRFTGREVELELLEQAFRQVVAGECRLCTIVGEPGVGKSRLVDRFLSQVATRASVVGGSCLSYGDGITYWAVAQIVRDMAGIEDELSPAEAQALLEAQVAHLPNAQVVAARIGQLLGLSDIAVTGEGTAAAIGDFLAAGARSRPMVVVVDDIQWAQPVLLDLLAGLPAVIAGAPILLLCLARPELLDHRRDWPVTVKVEPLDERDVGMLLEGLLGTADPGVTVRLASTSGGNPLFVEELVAMLVDDGVLILQDGVCTLAGDLRALALPASLHALLGARLDALEPLVRGTLERGAIEGEVFHRGATVELSPPETQASVRPSLGVLLNKDFIRPAEAHFVGEAAFRFKHILVRDAAYRGTPKKLRAALHEHFATWLEGVAGARVVEYEEILGYHLEQSYRYRTELGPIDDEIRVLAERAALHLAEAGRRAAQRADIDAASGLLSRAADLLPTGHPGRARILAQLGETLMDGGRSAEAVRVLDGFDESDGVDEISRARAEVCRGELELGLGSTRATVDRLRRKARAAIDLFAANDEEQALVRACWLLYLTSMTLCRSGTAREAIDRLIDVSDRFSQPLPGRLPGMLAMNLAWGPTPVPGALAETESILERVRDDPAAEPVTLGAYAYLLAQDGSVDAARQALARMREIVDRQGQRLVLWGSWGQNTGRVELLAGDPANAERALRPAYEGLVEAQQFGFSCTAAGYLAHALVDLGRPAEASEYAAAARDAASEADALSQILWRSALARARALGGEAERPLALVDEAVCRAETTEFPNLLADTLLDQARVRHSLGRPVGAVVERADAIYAAKGNRAGRAKAAALDPARGRPKPRRT
jgi:class 3 adenylate cyclase/tetratricopeptide (TPR) repeat protein